MTRVIPMKFLLPGGLKQLRVEHSDDGWMIWLNANGNFTLGTFLELSNDGNISRITWHPDGSQTKFEVSEDKS